MEKFQKIVATGFLVHDGKVLVVKRSEQEKFLPGNYELPGGKIEFGEDPVEGLKREFQEEVGLTIDPQRPYRTFAYVSGDGNRHTAEILYLSTYSGNEDVHLSPAHTEYKWITEAKVGSYQISDEIKKSIIDGFAVVNR